MNYLPLPVFVEFEIDDIWDFSRIDKVCFTMVHGVDSIECDVSAVRKVEAFEVSNDIDPQKSLDRDFEYLQVESDAVVEVELEHVQKIKLTEKQLLELNEYLKQEMKII